MNIIYIDQNEASIKTTQATLHINARQIPFKLIDTLIFIGTYTLNTKDIFQFSKNSIYTLFISKNLSNTTLLLPKISKNSELKLAQYRAALTPLPIAKEILQEKIKTHNEHLKQHSLNSKDLTQKIENAKTLDELLGIEGSYSSYYFKQYFTLFPKKLAKGTRSKQPPLDAVNAILSFTYTLFYNLITIKLLSYGFEPGIGFLHRPFRSHNALSSDILECHRAAINEFTYKLFQKSLNINDFTKDKGVYLKYKSRVKFWKEYQNFFQSQEPKIEQSISNLRSQL